MPIFTPEQQHTLTLICNTFVPRLPDKDRPLFSTGAAALDLGNTVAAALEQVTDDTDRMGLRLFLGMIENDLLNRLTVGIGQPFSLMTRDERERLLRAWAHSNVPTARQLFQSLKRLTLFIAYSTMPGNQPNPTWRDLGYTPPERDTSNGERPIKPLNVTQPTILTCDVVIVGSGAGGGVVAGELAEAGYDVIVVEKGDYYHDTDFHGRELESHEKLFEKYGSLTTSDKGMVVLAGSVLGGGTTINWTASFRTPDDVREEWARDYGFEGADTQEFDKSLDEVMKRINVNTETPASPQNSALAEGCEKLGYEVGVIPRNVKGCEECGFCNFGCAFGAKQGTLKTYLQDAHNRGARFLVRGYTERVLIERGAAVGVLVTVTANTGQPHEVTIRAKAVVVSAGAIHTPALLLRSGLQNANIGANLHLHPTTVVYGIYDHPIRGWEGAPVTRISRQFANLDGQGYGVRLETAPVHPGIAALSLTWESGRQHKETMAQLECLSNIIIITRDRYRGRVTVDKQGAPVLHYRLHPSDARHVMRGITEALKVLRAAGARELSSPHAKRMVWCDGDSRSFDDFLAAVQAAGLKPNGFSLFSAHQMSSAHIGGDTATGALNPMGETYEIRNLYVADASAMPTATGVNPMISIMATAHYIAGGMKGQV
jgi:choline dehydrogenase-like flavoprotein